MLDLLPEEIWAVHPSPTFLEPACGDGNFLVAILERKLDRLGRARGVLPAGASAEAMSFHALEALASIYAVDFSRDNVVGGTPGHEVGARDRLLGVLGGWLESELGTGAPDSLGMLAARWIVTRNVQVGNMLPSGLGITASGRDALPIHGYDWDPRTLTVSVTRTTLGAVLADSSAEATGIFSLFAPAEPAPVWSGPALSLHQAGTKLVSRRTSRKVRAAPVGR